MTKVEDRTCVVDIELSSYPKQPWFDSDVKTQHRVVRNQEYVWLKYNLQSNWKSYKAERNVYNRLLAYKKKQAISKKVKKLRGDTKGLYKLTANLIGNKTINPMPPDKLDAQLADDFAEFFTEKIHKIRQQLICMDAYNSEPNDIPRLRKFHLMMESEVGKIINSMQRKTCELDLIPTPLLKRLITKCLPHITRIISISLTEGIFSDK